jgi:hypothetical protein
MSVRPPGPSFPRGDAALRAHIRSSDEWFAALVAELEAVAGPDGQPIDPSTLTPAQRATFERVVRRVEGYAEITRRDADRAAKLAGHASGLLECVQAVAPSVEA